MLRDGSVRLVLVDRPLARVPQLAIHLDRDVNERGLRPRPQAHLTPVWGLGPGAEGDLAAFVAASSASTSADVAAFDLMLHDLTPPARLGADDELIAAARLDNLFSCWAGIEALAAGDRRRPGHPASSACSTTRRSARPARRAPPGRCSRS